MVLTRAQARAFYDHFGKKQDAQGFYEDAALDDLVDHASFERAERVFELGCGTGRFALRLLEKHLPPSATYLCTDISGTMTGIAEQRLSGYAERARAIQSDGSMRFPLPDHCVDRVVSTYVFDLLPEADMRDAISETSRVLVPGGKLCLVSLSHGVTVPSRMVCALWSGIFRLHPSWVGGCRPVRLAPLFDPLRWSIDYRNVIYQFGVPSEVLVASPKSTPGNAFDPQRRAV